ncbi:hypothetical protein [Smaragdicoccus niigatensis]|uniref:hypothetical protein n=1 Tax=Smaragdicoccus niigatensis TaxID=359359 RepID=UPI0003631197|nr:hypothetical protein [Smaragdicoccus niigatensis]
MSARRLLVIGIPAFAFLALIGATWLDGVVGSVDFTFWRQSILAPVIITYIVAIEPLVDRLRDDAFASLRRLAVDTAAFDAIVADGAPRPRSKVISALLGALIGIALLQPWREVEGMAWTITYRVVATLIMCGFVGLIVRQSFAGTSVLTRLHRLRLRVNVFNPNDLEPIAKRNLFTSLVLLGGISIGILLFPNQDAPGLAITISITVIAAALFFLSLRNTHRVMAGAKQSELNKVRANMRKVYRELKLRYREDDFGESLGQLNTLSNIWSNYEKRLKEAPEWPFTNSMVRRLVLTTLIPVVLLSTQKVAIEGLLGVLNLSG